MFTYIKTDNGYKCPHCDYERVLQSTVHMHIRAKHSGAFKQKCEHCPYETTTKTNLENHMVNKHPEEANKNAMKDLDCPCCTYVCRTPPQLRSHYLLKHKTDAVNKLFIKNEDMISCEGCKKEFKSKAAFIYHVVSCLSEEEKASEKDKKGMCLH